MIGLALSMGASSLLLPRQDDGAVAAEPLQVEPTATTVVPLPEQVAPQQSDPEPEISSSRSESTAGTAHVVRAGETLWSIAQRYQIDVQVLADANDIAKDSVLRVGQTIQVPVAARPSDLSATAESTEGDNALSAERNNSLSRLREQRDKLRTSLSGLQEAERTEDVAVADAKEDATPTSTPNIPSSPASVKDRVPSAANEIASSPTPGTIVHRVKPGDTLAAIAERYGVSRTEVAHANQLEDLDQLQVNQVLVIPTTATLNSAERSTTAPSTTVYRVVPGDTLSEIARIHNVSRTSLMSLNHLSNPNFILVGQVLQIPETETSLTGNRFETATGTSTTASAELTMPSAQFAPEGANSGSATLAQVPEVTGIPTIPMPPSAQPTIVASTADVSFSPEFSETPAPPQEVAVAPLSTPAPANNTSTVPTSVSSTNPYVENLMSEIYTMRDRLREQHMGTASAPVVQQPTVVAAIGGTAAPTERVNPEFNPERFNQLEATQPRQQVAAPIQVEAVTAPSQPTTAQPDVVAVAPLGSESYAPLLQPLAGQLVSPELPALPDATAYLPDSPGQFNGYMWPAHGVLTSGYGWRWGRMHRGIDIGAPVGTPVYAAADGVVEYSGWNSGGYGNMVEIRHADGSVTRYAHHSRNLVRVGQEVRQGEQIAEVGSTGYSTGPHLHFEVHLPNQGTVNPIAYLPR